MTQAPRVTVLMSVFNAERFVREAVDSVLGQTFEGFEFLIFDDGSTDATAGILRGCLDPRIRLVSNGTNRGLTWSLAAGMRIARGEYVARMDADDVCEPHRLAAQVAYLDANRDVAVLGSAVRFFGDSGRTVVARQPLGHERIQCALLYGFTMLHPSVMIRRGALERHGLEYDPAFPVSQDHDLWTRAIRRVRFANLDEPLVAMREHDGKIGRRDQPQQRAMSNRIRRRQLDELGVTATDDDVRLLGELDAPGCAWTAGDCEAFDALLLSIFAANARARIYDQAILVAMGCSRFRGKCRQLLVDGNKAGRYYWRSAARRVDDPTVRELAGMAVRSLLADRARAPGP
jgi:glycosyltransferase involved in cell wall biosynthesis